jgi:two-component system sensor histidine kinase BaeS
MLDTLRNRLILSHVLPLMVIIPIVGVALVYTLETRVLLVNLSRELEAQAILSAEVANDFSAIWHDAAQAQAFVARFGPRLTARLMLLTPEGILLASSDPADSGRVGRALEPFNRADVLDGKVSVHTTYSRQQDTEIAQVLVPVMDAEQQMMGVVRLSRQLTTFYDWFLRLRYLIVGVLAAGLVLGAVAGLLLALTMERPLRQVTEAISALSSGRKLTPLPEQGPAEMRLLVRAFNSLVERLHTLEEARRQLLANLVHELRRPLGALYPAVEALLGGAHEEPELHQDLLEGMARQIKRLERVLDDLARLHDRVLGTLELNYEFVALSPWLAQVLSPWREAACRKNLQWEATVPADLPILEADPDRLSQALGNLLSNAVKYTPAGGSVTVKANLEDGSVAIHVEDTGPGIAQDEQNLVFTPFYRGRVGGRFPQGMGLGLTIARDLVTAHGGQIEVESMPGQGSHFTIRLPLPAWKS